MFERTFDTSTSSATNKCYKYNFKVIYISFFPNIYFQVRFISIILFEVHIHFMDFVWQLYSIAIYIDNAYCLGTHLAQESSWSWILQEF